MAGSASGGRGAGCGFPFSARGVRSTRTRASSACRLLSTKAQLTLGSAGRAPERSSASASRARARAAAQREVDCPHSTRAQPPDRPSILACLAGCVQRRCTFDARSLGSLGLPRRSSSRTTRTRCATSPGSPLAAASASASGAERAPPPPPRRCTSGGRATPSRQMARAGSSVTPSACAMRAPALAPLRGPSTWQCARARRAPPLPPTTPPSAPMLTKRCAR
mmetsp:Transcript_25093/g.62187  ORF Transcript_25093/g.62187 Transcript_25093/m.62187 type:complete len:222 (+) Transcript_25093:563-1228(+)